MEERERRIAQNEVLFREVNERLRALNKAFSEYSGAMEIVCECGDLACTQQLSISPAGYAHIRSDPTWFAIIPGHESAGVENIVASHDAYDIVQKRAAAVSQAADPRARA